MKLTGPSTLLFAGAASALLTSACAVGPTHTAPPAVPATFSVAEGASNTPRDSSWYRGFGSPELDRLMAEGAQGNLDLEAATARMRQAAARARGAHAALQPQLGAGAGVNRYTGRADGSSANETDWSALISASYELDFWGRNHAVAQEATSLSKASVADRVTVELTTQGAIASSYFAVLALRERAAVSQEYLATARDVLKVVSARQGGGAASLGEVASQAAAVATSESAVADLQAQEAAALAMLAVAAGHDPEGFAVEARSLEALREPSVAAGLPSELLLRRPDLISAEATLAAASANVRVARAAFLPTIPLTAAGGLQNPALQAAVTTLTGTGPTLTLGAALVQGVFDGGQRRAAREEALAREQEMLANYRSAVRSALLDVETTLAMRQSLDTQLGARERALAQTTLALQVARARYQAGAGDFLTLLDAQRSMHAARDSDAQYRLARFQACVALFKAIGGGWHQP